MPISKKCRCCLQESEQMYIYDHLFKKMFQDTFNILAAGDDKVPQWICLGCIVSLKQAKKFRDMVVAAERKLLQELSKKDNDTISTTVQIKIEPYEESPGASSTRPVNNVWIREQARVETGDTLADDEAVPTSHEYEVEPSGESKFSKNSIIVPDVKSVLCNFKKGSQETVFEETKNKRRLTGPTKLRENIILLILNSTIVPFRHNSNFLNDYICYYCENTYRTMKELKEHTESEHDGKVNNDYMMTLMRNRAHKLINADIGCIKCRLCDEVLKTIENLIEHLVHVHRKIYHNIGKEALGILGFDLSTDELKCHLCTDKFDSFKMLYSHMNEHFEAHSCSVCKKKFANLLRYRTHMKSHVIQEFAEYKCDHCPIVCKNKTVLVYHIKRHHLNITLKCDLCPQTFPFKEYRKRDEHMVEIHGMPKQEQKYTCDICQNGKTYSSKNTLKIHKSNIHKVGDVPRYKCELCEFVTHHSKRMSEHMNVHNRVKNYGCDLCERKFTKPCTLRNHIGIHLNEKRFACSLCEEAYVHKSMLQHHMKKKHPESDIKVENRRAVRHKQSSNEPNCSPLVLPDCTTSSQSNDT